MFFSKVFTSDEEVESAKAAENQTDLFASTPQMFTRTPQISTSASQISAPTPHMFSSATDSLPLQTDQHRSTPARDVTQQDLAIGFAGLTRRMMLPSSTLY